MGNLAARESKGETVERLLYRVETPVLASDELAELIGEVRRTVEQWEVPAAACRLAPEYLPGAELRRNVNAGVRA